MKTKAALLACALVGALLARAADTVSAATAVFLQADAASPVIARLPAGAAAPSVGEAPAGWRRVEVSGAFEAYAHSRDITKALEVREGASILTGPEKTSAVLTVAQPGDHTEVTGLHGDYCQIRFEKKLQGFIAVGENTNRPATEPAAATAPRVPVAPPAGSASAPGRPVPITGQTADLPRHFSGTLVLARRPLLNPHPPYDHQLTDSTGRRFAYVDTQRLRLTEKLETFLDREVVINGTIRNTVDGQDLVVAAETIQRKP